LLASAAPASIFVAARPAANNADAANWNISAAPAARTGKWLIGVSTRGFATLSHTDCQLNGVALVKLAEHQSTNAGYTTSLWASLVDIAVDGTDTIFVDHDQTSASSCTAVLFGVDNVLNMSVAADIAVAPSAQVSSLTTSTAVDVPAGGIVVGKAAGGSAAPRMCGLAPLTHFGTNNGHLQN
jgi:hypothetical protein